MPCRWPTGPPGPGGPVRPEGDAGRIGGEGAEPPNPDRSRAVPRGGVGQGAFWRIRRLRQPVPVPLGGAAQGAGGTERRLSPLRHGSGGSGELAPNIMNPARGIRAGWKRNAMKQRMKKRTRILGLPVPVLAFTMLAGLIGLMAFIQPTPASADDAKFYLDCPTTQVREGAGRWTSSWSG